MASIFYSAYADQTQRAVPRYSVAAVAEIVDPAKAVRLSGRVVSLSRKGCFMYSLTTLPVGTVLNLKISGDEGTFTTRGRVIYAQESVGNGVTFLDSSEEQLKTLDSWLAKLS